MIMGLRQHLIPPRIPRDEDNLVAGILHYLVLGTVLITVAFMVASQVLGLAGDSQWINWVALVGLIGLYVLLRKEYVRETAWIFCFLMWGLVTTAAFEGGGLGDLHFSVSSILVVVLASVLLGRRGSLIFTSLVILTSLVIYYMFPVVGFSADKSKQLFNLLLDDSILVAVSFFTGFSVHTLNKTLQRAQRSESQLAEHVTRLKVEIEERQQVEKALLASQESSRQLQNRLRKLNEVSLALAKISKLEDLCRKAIEQGHVRLDFDRLSICLIDNKKSVQVAMQLDGSGKIYAFTSADQIHNFEHDIQLFGHPDEDEVSVKVFDKADLYDEQHKIIGSGWRLVTGLFDHEKLIGWMAADNSTHQRELQPSDSEILQLFGVNLAYLFTRLTSEAALAKMAFEKEHVELVNELISNLSHDLRTPLSIIKTSSYLLKHIPEPERQLEKLTIIQDQTDRLEKLIADIMTMIKLDQSETITLKPTNLNEIIEKFVVGFRVALEKRQQTFDMEIDPQIPLVLGSSDGVYRILTNLLENASQYTPENGSIGLRTSMVDRMIVMEVRDSGIGIHEDDLPHIFERFYRADKARSLKSGGMGLGLAITKRLVDMHGGKIEVSSTLGSGTVFKVSFQRSAISSPTATVVQEDKTAEVTSPALPS